MSSRAQLQKILQQTGGLADHVRFGVPLPQETLPHTSTPNPESSPHIDKPYTPGAEEAFPPDAFLRPLASRAEQGCLAEITGEISSGRTALAQRLAARVTARGELLGWVDFPSALDARSLLRAGADLRSILWVRPPDVWASLRSAELLVKTGFAGIIVDLEGVPPKALSKLGPPIWTRLLRAVRRSRATVLLLSPERLLGSFATLGLQTTRDRARFESGLLEGLDSRVDVVRDRSTPWPQSILFQVDHRPNPDLYA